MGRAVRRNLSGLRSRSYLAAPAGEVVDLFVGKQMLDHRVSDVGVDRIVNFGSCEWTFDGVTQGITPPERGAYAALSLRGPRRCRSP